LLHEAKVVRFMFDSLVRQQHSIGQIVRDLNAQGIPTRRGAPRWDRATVWAILGNPAYKGKAAFGKNEVVEARTLLRPIRGKGTPRRAKSASRDKPEEDWIYIDVPAIVSTEVFNAAAAQLERNRRLSQRNGRGQRYLLQGLTVCAQCGYAFYGKTVSKSAAKGGRRYAYYRCVGTDGYRFGGDRICHNPQVRVDQLDGYVWDSVCQLLRDPERVMQDWSQRAGGDGVDAGLREQRDHAARLLDAQERILKRLLDAYERRHGRRGPSMPPLATALAAVGRSSPSPEQSTARRSTSGRSRRNDNRLGSGLMERSGIQHTRRTGMWLSTRAYGTRCTAKHLATESGACDLVCSMIACVVQWLLRR
jgi:site-specific DNA recombinase